MNQIITIGEVKNETPPKPNNKLLHCRVCECTSFYPVCEVERTSKWWIDRYTYLHCVQCNTRLPGRSRDSWILPRKVPLVKQKSKKG